jgi:hypothetical protein
MMKNLNEIQFESELYWQGNNSYLVTGVKSQYEKMKRSKNIIIQITKISAYRLRKSRKSIVSMR